MMFILTDTPLKEFAYKVVKLLKLDSFGETDVFIEYEDLGEIDGAIYGDSTSACIEINPMQSFEDQMRALAHEFVHVHQLFRGDLTYKGADMFFKGVPMSDLAYEDQAHEIEAFKWETWIYEACKITVH